MSGPVRHVQVRLDEETFAWFEQNFSVASKQAFFEECAKYLRIAVETGTLPLPNIYPAKCAVEAAKTLIAKDNDCPDCGPPYFPGKMVPSDDLKTCSRCGRSLER